MVFFLFSCGYLFKKWQIMYEILKNSNLSFDSNRYRSIIFRLFLLFLLVTLTHTSCHAPMMKEERLHELNHNFSNTNWRVKEAIFPPYTSNNSSEPLFNKGEKIRIWLELNDQWIKVKAYKPDDPREQARGKIIIFIIFDEFKEHFNEMKDEKGDEALQQEIEQILNHKIDNLLIRI